MTYTFMLCPKCRVILHFTKFPDKSGEYLRCNKCGFKKTIKNRKPPEYRYTGVTGYEQQRTEQTGTSTTGTFKENQAGIRPSKENSKP